ncbi:condensation domain-containing protein [Nitratireductor sp. GCM10026969]|uniref:condensation domain-containing protein n=1 Tax=Nitratireductor sp. GCM10026969 TaxID=3252645 RepID=UPI003611FD51
MAGHSDRLLARNELRRFNETFEEPAAEVRAAEEAQRPSEHEERTWLAQQQDPDAVFKRILAYRLGGWPDIAKLVHAVQTLVRAMPDLNARYRFDDDGELHKHFNGDEGQYLEVLSADSRREAVETILARQAAPWHPEHEPPFKVLLILGRGEVVVALLMHRILDEACSPENVLDNLTRAYNGDPLQPAVMRQTAAPATETDYPAPVDWIRRGEPDMQIEVIDFGESRANPAKQRVALRYGTVVETDSLNGLAGSPPDALRLLATISVQFAHFLCDLGGHAKIGLVLPRQPEARLGDHGLLAPPDLLHLVVERDLPVADAAARVAAHLEAQQTEASGGMRTAPETSLPQAHVAWLTDPRRFFAPRSVTVERLPMPTLETRPDLALAVGLDAEGRTILELVTGQAVSPYAGAFLLERFTDFVRGKAVTGAEGAIFPFSLVRGPKQADATAAASPGRNPADGEAVTALILSEFREALASPEMGPDDDFFDHGGHSLIATRIIGRLLGDHGIEVHFNDLFSYPTAASLARHAKLTDATASASSLADAANSSSIAPLSLAQMSLWKAYAAFGFNEIFNIPFALEFLDPVDEHVFECAFTDILERHPGLRTLFVMEGEDVRQQVVPMYELPRYKWFWSSKESEDVDRHQEAGHRFDLARELPIRLRFMVDPATKRQILSFLFHHIVLDEWSVNLMMDELAEAYRARAAGTEPAWATSPRAFQDFARLQNASGVDAAHLAYWTDMLRDAPHGLPLFEGQTAAGDRDGEASPAGGWVEFKLESEICEGLYTLARENSASLFNVAYAAIAASLATLGRLDELVVGTSASGRTDPDFFDTIGYFTTVVAHRVRFTDGMKVGALITTVKNTINESMPHTDIPIDLVEEALGMTPGRDHLFEVFIQIHAKNKLNGALPTPDGGRLEFRQIDPDKQESLLGLQFEVMEETIGEERAIRVLMSYRADHYRPEQVELIRSTTRNVFALFSRPSASDVVLAELEPVAPEAE